MTVAALSERYSTVIGELPGGADLAGIRLRALQQFEALGLPNRRIETWHYTDLSGLGQREFDYLGAMPDAARIDAAATALARLELDPAAARCVFVDGHLVPSLSDWQGMGGLDVETLAESPARLIGTVSPCDSALAALNTAFARSGLLVRVAAAVESPLQIVFIGAGTGIATQQKLRFELAPGARLSVALTLTDPDAAADGWLNQLIEIDQASNSELTFCRLQQLPAAATLTTLVQAELADGARLTTRSIELGAALVRHELKIALNGDGADADLAGFTLTSARQHTDVRIAVEHAAPRTTSRQEFRAIASDHSRSVFNGKVTVREQAQHIDARQKSDNLLLSPTAEIDTKPELEIYADQVACSHGATVGELSDDHLFYLRSRGIDDATARSILTTAFAAVILAQISDPKLRAQADSAVMARLSQLQQTRRPG